MMKNLPLDTHEHAATGGDLQRAAPHAHVQADDEAGHEHAEPLAWRELLRIAVVALAAAAVWFRLWEPFQRVSVVGLAGAAIGGYPIFKEG